MLFVKAPTRPAAVVSRDPRAAPGGGVAAVVKVELPAAPELPAAATQGAALSEKEVIKLHSSVRWNKTPQDREFTSSLRGV